MDERKLSAELTRDGIPHTLINGVLKTDVAIDEIDMVNGFRMKVKGTWYDVPKGTTFDGVVVVVGTVLM